jgi:hypothetical protein
MLLMLMVLLSNCVLRVQIMFVSFHLTRAGRSLLLVVKRLLLANILSLTKHGAIEVLRGASLHRGAALLLGSGRGLGPVVVLLIGEVAFWDSDLR